MMSLTRISSLFVLMNLSGCAFLSGLKQDSSSDDRSHYPSLQTFKFEGTVIYYKDLSDPCDDTTVAWNDLKEVASIQEISLDVIKTHCDDARAIQSITVSELKVQNQISIPFALKQVELSDDASIESFSTVNDFVSTNTVFHIYGAAGTVGKRSEELGLARASYVRDHLVGMGVEHERITIMPYDPKIPGLQALVKVLGL